MTTGRGDLAHDVAKGLHAISSGISTSERDDLSGLSATRPATGASRPLRAVPPPEFRRRVDDLADETAHERAVVHHFRTVDAGHKMTRSLS
jgi:hypothetical protein